MGLVVELNSGGDMPKKQALIGMRDSLILKSTNVRRVNGYRKDIKYKNLFIYLTTQDIYRPWYIGSLEH